MHTVVFSPDGTRLALAARVVIYVYQVMMMTMMTILSVILMAMMTILRIRLMIMNVKLMVNMITRFAVAARVVIFTYKVNHGDLYDHDHEHDEHDNDKDDDGADIHIHQEGHHNDMLMMTMMVV